MKTRKHTHDASTAFSGLCKACNPSPQPTANVEHIRTPLKRGEGPGDQAGRDRFITDRVWLAIHSKTDLEIIRAVNLVSKLEERFPGLVDGETDVNGVDLVDFLTQAIAKSEAK